MDETVTPLGWWAISGEALLNMLNRVACGEAPDAVFMEEYANCEHDQAEGDD